jgi:hypothetical protein
MHEKAAQKRALPASGRSAALQFLGIRLSSHDGVMQHHML